MNRFRKILGRERGQAALEALIVFPIWLVVLTLFVNMLLFLGSAMLLQANVDRAALQASSLGGVTAGSNGIENQLLARSGFGAHNVSVVACYLPGSPGPGTDNGYYKVTADDFTGASGVCNSSDANGAADRNAVCVPGAVDCVPDGDFIFIDVTYQQSLWLFGDITVHREALVISHSYVNGQ